ncbi:MAG: 3D domain-containing protein [Chloroflexota bacterium]
MPLVAVLFVLSSFLHALVPQFTVLNRPTFTQDAVSFAEATEIVRRNADAPAAMWVAPHTETPLWSAAGQAATDLGVAYQWVALEVTGQSEAGRLPVWDSSRQVHGWVRAQDVGPVDPALVGTEYLPPVGKPIAWSGPARITKYTCVELGGCAPTASGLWPEPGMVAVDPTVIPLGSTVWIQGVGTFLATDTGSMVRGAHLDIFSLDYQEALVWGVQQRTILVYAPQ